MLAPLQTHQFPEADEFWKLHRKIELRCEARSTDAELAGEYQRVSDGLGTLLSLLYRFSRGYWGCREGQRGFEHLAGLACKSGLAAFRMLQSGYYSEALGPTRNIAEIGNLLHLFYVDQDQIQQWLDMPVSGRNQIYSPSGVRRALTVLGSPAPTSQVQYAWLAETSQESQFHAVPDETEARRRAALGMAFSRNELNQGLAALAWAVCTVTGPLAKLADLDEEVADRLFEETINLAVML